MMINSQKLKTFDFFCILKSALRHLSCLENNQADDNNVVMHNNRSCYFDDTKHQQQRKSCPAFINDFPQMKES